MPLLSACAFLAAGAALPGTFRNLRGRYLPASSSSPTTLPAWLERVKRRSETDSAGDPSAFARCHCGAFTLVVPDAARQSGGVSACHCSMCRMQSGAAFVPFVAMPRTIVQPALEASSNTLKHRSSAFATRWWCGECGCFVGMDYNEEHTVWLTMGIFERFPHAGCISPKRDSQIFCESAAPWLAPMQTLPALQKFGTVRSDGCNPAGPGPLWAFNNGPTLGVPVVGALSMRKLQQAPACASMSEHAIIISPQAPSSQAL